MALIKNFNDRIILGRTGLSVGRLGIASAYGVPATAVERAYHEYGINYFYWGSIRRRGMRDGLRNLIKNHRDDIVIALQTYDHFGITINRAIQKGIKALGIDYADVALLGWHNRFPAKNVIDGALELKEKGLICHIGLSGHNRKFFGTLAQNNDSPIDIFMIRYNAAHRGAEEDIFPHLQEENRPGITTFTAVCWGKLLTKRKMPPGEEPLSAGDCYRFALSNPNVDLCMMGLKTEQELIENVAAVQKGPLSEEEMGRIIKIGDHVHG